MARRPALVLPLTAALLVAAAAPALAGSSANGGCTTGEPSSVSSGDRTTQQLTDDRYSAVVAPSTGTISGTSDVVYAGVDDDCGVNASFTDRLRVVAPGLAAGAPVTVRVTLQTSGALAASGSDTASHAARASVTGTYTAFGTPPAGCAECGLVVSAAVSADAWDTRYGADDDGADWSWSLGNADGGVADSGLGAGFDSQAATFDVVVPVGELLNVDSRLSWNSTAHDGESAASVDASFGVTWAGVTEGVSVVPEGTEPQPEPEPSAYDRIQNARGLLAGFDMHPGVKHALDVKLAHAQRALLDGDEACDELSSFVSQVEAQRGKQLTDVQADAVLAEITVAMDALGC